jgi:diamine N-acetyltransferase
MNLSIKEASTDDIPVIHELAAEIWRQYYPEIISAEQIEYMLDKMYSETSLQEQLKNGHRFFLASAEKPVGYFSFQQLSQHDFFLHKLYVKTNGHRKGVGKQMLDLLLQMLPHDSTLRLTTNRRNYKAINFYFKNQFIIEEVKDIDIGNGFWMKDFVMLRKI